MRNPFDWEAALLDLRVGEPRRCTSSAASREFDVDVNVADLPEVNAPKVQVLSELELVTRHAGHPRRARPSARTAR